MHDVRAIHDAVKRLDFTTAFRLGNAALNDDPENPEVLYLVGAALRATGSLGLAYLSLSKALAKNQKQPNLWMTYGATLHDMGKWGDAEKAFLHVQKMMPSDPMPPANIAATYVQRGKWSDGLLWADKALKLDGECHIAKVCAGFANLSLGRWMEGWKSAEALYGNHLNVRLYNEGGEPQWDGTPGQTVVVQCDQGVGDIIMFSQCLPLLQERCKEVIVDCAPRLVSLFKRNFPGVIVYGTLKETEVDWLDNHKIDATIHISFLGRFFLHNDKDFQRKAYIKPDPELVAKWTKWLEQYPKPWRGIAWKGGVAQTQTTIRSIDLQDMAPLITGTVIDLSYHDASREVAEWNIDNKTQIIRPPIDTRNYDDTVALVAALDEVTTVTTTVAHVCGSMGKRAHVLVPSVAQWRYAYRCEDGMIWYPPDSVKLHRQKPGELDWHAAINRLAKEVNASGHDLQ